MPAPVTDRATRGGLADALCIPRFTRKTLIITFRKPQRSTNETTKRQRREPRAHKILSEPPQVWYGWKALDLAVQLFRISHGLTEIWQRAKLKYHGNTYSSHPATLSAICNGHHRLAGHVRQTFCRRLSYIHPCAYPPWVIMIWSD